MEKNPSLFDVARIAGVSHQTVSRVVNRKENVSPSTRRRVFEAIERTGYKPNHSARALATGKTQSIGVIGLNSTLHGPVTMNHAVQRYSHELGLVPQTMSVQSIKVDELRKAIRHLAERGVDGIISIVPRGAKVLSLKELNRSTIPLVLRDHPSLRDGLVVDQREVCREAIRHLIKLGHERIAFIGGDPEWFDAIQRFEAWAQFLEDLGLDNSMWWQGDWSARSGYENCKDLLQSASPVTAIAVASDQISLGVLKALNEAKRDDISVVSMDGSEDSAFFYPSLTSVRHDFHEVGKRLVHHLAALLGKADAGSFGAPPRIDLAVRESTKPPRPVSVTLR